MEVRFHKLWYVLAHDISCQVSMPRSIFSGILGINFE